MIEWQSTEATYERLVAQQQTQIHDLNELIEALLIERVLAQRILGVYTRRLEAMRAYQGPSFIVISS